MKPAVMSLICFLLLGCNSPSVDSVHTERGETGKRQQSEAESLKDQYQDCIDDINHKTAVENYTDKATRREVVMESCSEITTRFTIVQEQAYDNACRAAGRSLTVCDSEAVSKARLDTEGLLLKAREQIDRTSAARRALHAQ